VRLPLPYSLTCSDDRQAVSVDAHWQSGLPKLFRRFSLGPEDTFGLRELAFMQWNPPAAMCRARCCAKRFV
jgi:hypothetical protein